MRLLDIAREVIRVAPNVIAHLSPRTRFYLVALKGGEGSGNFGHAGRPGEVGGSAPSGGLSVQTESAGSYSGQHNYVMSAYTESGELAATLQYSVYQGIPHIDMVESQKKGLGAGAELVRNLSSEYGYENIEWGMMTDDGKKLQSKLDNEYGVTREFVSYNSTEITDTFNGSNYSDNPKDFNASFSLNNYNNVVNELNKIGAENIEIDIAENEVFITAKLPDDKEVISIKSSAFKSYDFMLARVEGLVRGVYTGNVGGDFVDIMGALIRGQMEDAYRQAWNDEGYEGALPDYLNNSLDAFVIQQANFDWIYQFYKDIVDARVDKTPIDQLLARARMWANQWNAAYNEALRVITLENGGNMIWVLGEAEHCPTCLALDGIVASAKEWQESGWKPQGENLACHGFNCKCSCPPTSNRRSKNAAERLAAIR